LLAEQEMGEMVWGEMGVPERAKVNMGEAVVIRDHKGSSV